VSSAVEAAGVSMQQQEQLCDSSAVWLKLLNDAMHHMQVVSFQEPGV